mgnify:CR=1 FL=1|jgi:hypothetical protein
METTENIVEIPATFICCMNSNCKMKETCLRFFATSLLSPEIEVFNALNPKNLPNDASCEYYKEKKLLRYAYGIPNTLFENIQHKNYKPLLDTLVNHFGHTTYYNIKNGKRPIDEQEQEYIKQQFLAYGYQGDVVFKIYKEGYNW